MAGLRTSYKPRHSVYVRAHRAIREAYDENDAPLTSEQVKRKLTVTPGIMFAEGVSLEDALNTLEVWKLLEKDSEGKYIPLN